MRFTSDLGLLRQQCHTARDSTGALGTPPSGHHRRRVGTEPRIPLGGNAAPSTLRSTPGCGSAAASGPPRWLHRICWFLHHAFTHHVVHRRFHKPRTDLFTVAVALAVVRVTPPFLVALIYVVNSCTALPSFLYGAVVFSVGGGCSRSPSMNRSSFKALLEDIAMSYRNHLIRSSSCTTSSRSVRPSELVVAPPPPAVCVRVVSPHGDVQRSRANGRCFPEPGRSWTFVTGSLPSESNSSPPVHLQALGLEELKVGGASRASGRSSFTKAGTAKGRRVRRPARTRGCSSRQ